MAKKKKKQGSVKAETPRQAIISRGRKLEIYECWINRDWVYNKMANIVITRKHTNGNITLAIFLADLYLKGIKDVAYRFNMPFPDYENFIDRYFEEDKFTETDYPIVHNIIYGALEFTEETGYKPHNDFAVAQYLLEEDDDRVELLNIAFGYKGKPCLLKDYDENYLKDKAYLEEKLNPENYYTFSPNDFLLFHDPENEMFLEPENDLDMYNARLKNKDLSLEDVFEIITNGFNLALRQSDELQNKNKVMYYPQDILNVELQDTIVQPDFEDDDLDLYSDLIQLMEKEKPKKLKKLKSKFESFFAKYPDVPETKILKLDFYDKTGAEDICKTLLDELLQTDNLPLIIQNQMALYFHQKQQYENIFRAYNNRSRISEVPYSDSNLLHVAAFLFYTGIYYLSVNNIQQAEQYRFVLWHITDNDDDIHLEKKLKFKITIASAKAMGEDVTQYLPKELNQPL